MGKSPEEIQNEKDMQYMRGKPNRLEVANYVNSLLENKYMPMISSSVEALRLGIMVLQAIILSKGICTKEELEEITTQFIEQSKAEAGEKDTTDTVKTEE